VANAAADARVILFDLLTGPAPVAALASLQVDVDGRFGQRNAGRHPLDNDAELGSV
jgi:hypothetical protein